MKQMVVFLATVALLVAVAVLFIDTVRGDEIVRNPAVIREFKRIHPCPATKSIQKSCPGYVVDHIVPLCAGGADAVENLQWQDKNAALQKDKLEWWICRRIKQCLLQK